MKKGVLENQIRHILEIDEQSRNSDIRLMQVIWYSYHRDKLHTFDGVLSIKLEDLYTLPREDHIARLRRKIQNNEHQFVPTDRTVAMQRGFKNVDEWRDYLGYNNISTL